VVTQIDNGLNQLIVHLGIADLEFHAITAGRNGWSAD
jgi:hypothetical protein